MGCEFALSNELDDEPWGHANCTNDDDDEFAQSRRQVRDGALMDDGNKTEYEESGGGNDVSDSLEDKNENEDDKVVVR